MAAKSQHGGPAARGFRYHRAMLRLDPNRDPVAPRDAATVVVTRAGDAEVELFCVKRHPSSGFLGGALVFPGGKLAAEDRAPEWAELTTPLSQRARACAPDADHARAFAVAALRETLEEAGILPVAGRVLGDREIEELRAELAESTTRLGSEGRAFLELCRARRLVVDVARVEAMARWITPKAEERRYDTRFYVLGAPPGQSGRHDDHETTSSFWASPRELVRMWERGDVFLAPPTLRTVQLLLTAKSVEDAFAVARRGDLSPLCPFFAMDGELAVLALPGDPLYPEAHAPPADPEAPTRFELRDGRFIPERRA
jgi:8-oxo-dGTP pyrophosphatase MutT (NUDIX family)